MSELIKQLFVCPRTIGAICPSTSFLAKEITSGIDLDTVENVVEIGSGTGAFTGHILDRISPDTNFVAVEINKKVFQVLKNRFPNIKAHNRCASELNNILDEEKMGAADRVISGLPWAAFPNELQEKLLSSIYANMKPKGVFVTFAYLQGLLLPSAHRFKQRLERYFNKVQKGRVVWHNIPPAFVYRCEK